MRIFKTLDKYRKMCYTTHMKNPHEVTTRIIDTTSGSVVEFGYNTWVSADSDYQDVCKSYPDSIVKIHQAKREGKFWITVEPVTINNNPIDRPFKSERF
jgi:hypothetical protein